jgi:hypothetical protein
MLALGMLYVLLTNDDGLRTMRRGPPAPPDLRLM